MSRRWSVGQLFGEIEREIEQGTLNIVLVFGHTRTFLDKVLTITLCGWVEPQHDVLMLL